MKNHAFLIPAHKQPGLLARIIKNLQAPTHYFFIHVDGNTKNYDEFVDACSNLQNVVFVKRIPVYHCGISQVWATMIMLDAARKHPVKFDYYHQTSGQDYPLRTVEQFDQFFENTDDSFMWYNPEEEIADKWMRIYNMHVYYYHSIGKLNLLDKAIIWFGNTKIGSKLLWQKKIKNLAGAWDWWSWSDEVVNYIYEEFKRHTWFGINTIMFRYRYTCAPGEQMFATMLYTHLDELKIRKYFPLRYISITARRKVETSYRPYNLNELDYEYIINSPSFFCRKVDEVESKVLLDMIDQQRGSEFDVNATKYKFFF